MTTPDDLLRAIIADPANDDLRLLFADLLDDRGEGERASFIRVQVELASLPPPYPRYKVRRIERSPRQSIDFGSYNFVREGWDLVAEIDAKDAVKYPPPNPGDGVDFYGEMDGGATVEYFDNCVEDAEIQFNRDILLINARQGTKPDTHRGKRNALRRREKELLNTNGYQWAGAAASFIGPPKDWASRFRRGFVTEIRCVCDDWLTHGPALVRRQPIERVMITDMPIYPSGGNSTFYVGGLGRFPQEYWRGLEGLPTKAAALDALSKAALLWARQTEPATSV